jgi:hypothetical protein
MSDLSYWKRINRELYRRFMRQVDVYIYDKNTGDKLYGENMDKSFGNFSPSDKPTYSIEAYFPELPEWKAKLKKFGLDESRFFKAFFFYDSFTEAGVTRPTIGDHIVVEGERYKIIQDNPRDYFLNSQIPMTFQVDLMRIRPTSITTKPRTAQEDDLYPATQLKRGGA